MRAQVDYKFIVLIKIDRLPKWCGRGANGTAMD